MHTFQIRGRAGRLKTAAILRKYAEWGDRVYVAVPWRALWQHGLHELGKTGEFDGNWAHHIVYALLLAELLESEE